MVRTIDGDSDKFKTDYLDDLRLYDPRAFAWGSIWKETQRKPTGEDKGLTNSQMWAVWGEPASLFSTAMAGMTKKNKSDEVCNEFNTHTLSHCHTLSQVIESGHKVRWWDMDMNQLYRDWNNADSMASRVLGEVGGTKPGTSQYKDAKIAATVGMSWEKVQEAHLACMYKGEDRRTDFMLHKFYTRWRQNHRTKWEEWDDVVTRIGLDNITENISHEHDVGSDEDAEEDSHDGTFGPLVDV